MNAPAILDEVPSTGKLAAAAFLVYGSSVVLNAFAYQVAAGWGWENLRGLPWALVHLAAAGLIAWGLLRRARWAWWLGLGASLFGLAAGALVVLVVEHGDVYWLPPSRYQAFLVISFLCLGVAVAALVSPSARAAFRP